MLSLKDLGYGIVIVILLYFGLSRKPSPPAPPRIIYKDKIVTVEKIVYFEKKKVTKKRDIKISPDGSKSISELETSESDINALWSLIAEKEAQAKIIPSSAPRYMAGGYYHLRTHLEDNPRIELSIGPNLSNFLDLDLFKDTYLKFKADLDVLKPLDHPGFAVGLEKGFGS